MMILCILQARTTSKRLPGKVLKPILGKPMLLLQIERIRRAKKIDKLVVATSSDPSDDAIEQMCIKHNIDCYRGSLDDVLDRFYQVAEFYQSEHIVRLTGDCPLQDPSVIDNIVEMHLAGGYDHTCNGLERTFPDGLDVSVSTMKALRETWKEAYLPSHREHVTQYIVKNPQHYKLGNYKNDVDLSHLRWTVDEELDFILVEKIYTALYPWNAAFTTADVLDFLEENPELKRINSCFKYNEGLEKSLKEDEEYQNRTDLE